MHTIRDPRRWIADGRYELLERIGSGGSGAVFRAIDHAPPCSREVCIKRILSHLEPDEVRALREEGRLLASVRHANVVSLLAVGDDHDGPYLVLELIEGCDLRALSRSQTTIFDCAGYLPDRLAVHVACAVVRALGAVERALPGLVHRDVTPHNVLVSREGEVKLMDFGIALARDRARWTRPALIKGKFGYMSPEQVRGDELDVTTDLFAAGVVLYELLSRVRPWGDRPGMSELLRIERGEMTPLSAFRPKLHVDLHGVVHRLLAHDRRSRFATPDDALRALAPFGAGELGPLRLASCLSHMDPHPSPRNFIDSMACVTRAENVKSSRRP
ncbi:MAG: serine/threonine-protein kinase [Polyangiaceae bacterium]